MDYSHITTKKMKFSIFCSSFVNVKLCILNVPYDLLFYRVESDLIVKLTDNSLARDLFPGDYNCLGDNENRPVKWLSTEAITERRFSSASDVVRFYGSCFNFTDFFCLFYCLLQRLLLDFINNLFIQILVSYYC